MDFASARIQLHPSEPYRKRTSRESMPQCHSHLSPLIT